MKETAKISEGKEPQARVKGTQDLHAMIDGHHAGHEAHIDGLKSHGHEVADEHTRHIAY